MVNAFLQTNVERFIKLFSVSNMEDLYNVFCDIMQQVFIFDCVTFFKYNSDADKYEALWQKGSCFDTVVCPVVSEYASLEMLKWVSKSGKVNIIPVEQGKDYGVINVPDTIVLFPIMQNDSSFGVFSFSLSEVFESFLHDQMDFFSLLYSQMSIAIDNLMMLNELTSYKDFMKDVIENMINGIIVMDTDMKITYMNRNAQFLLSLQGGVGQTAFEIMDAELFNSVSKVLDSMKSGENIIDYQFDQKISEHQSVPLGISASILYSRDLKPSGYIVIFRDLSLTKEVLKLKELDAMKNDFISKVSHELRTPLTSISSYTEALLDGLADTKEESDSYLNIIEQECQRLISMVNDILDLSKMESGKMDFKISSINISDVIFSSVNTMRHTADAKNIKLNFEIEDEGLVVMADMDKVIQVMLNLISNALKFTPEEGSVSIKISDESHKVKVMVVDTGMGMDDHEVEHLFDKFYQVENVKHHQKGTGLGTSICKEIIESLGGKIWVTSKKGIGTTVNFTLPKGE